MINIDLPPVLKLCFAHARPGGDIVTLGRQKIGFPPEAIDTYLADRLFDSSAAQRLRASAITPEALLQAFGFRSAHSLDVSDYEGCTHVFDLNRNDLPQAWQGKYSVVYDGGTLEHVFDIATALRNCIALLEPGGLFVHIGPMNNWPDHGFYQFSPTLWFDFFVQNGFEILVSARIRLRNEIGRGESYRVEPLMPREAAAIPPARTRERDAHAFVARRPQMIAQPLIAPTQSFYDLRHGRAEDQMEMPTFHPFDVAAGRILPCAATLEPIAADDIARAAGGSFRIDVRRLGFPGGSRHRPFKSPLVVVEDGLDLPFVASCPEMVASCSPGRFCQRGWSMYFTSTDGSDPRTNGRTYELRAPATNESAAR